MYAIIGSGFGLYGYLPALTIVQGETVLLPRIYGDKIQARPELTGVLPYISWVDDEASALSRANSVVIATTPRRQFEIVSQCLTLPNINKYVLEKPLAASPGLAIELLAKLASKQKQYRIGYSFLHTVWKKKLIWPKESVGTSIVSINWTFMAHHFKNDLPTWKRVHQEGGGALRFYGIHLVALLAHYGYNDVHSSILVGENKYEPECWKAIFSGPELPDCHVHIDSRDCTNRFEITLNKTEYVKFLVCLKDPFECEARRVDNNDVRVAIIDSMLTTFEANDHLFVENYDHVNLLWRKIEDL